MRPLIRSILSWVLSVWLGCSMWLLPLAAQAAAGVLMAATPTTPTTPAATPAPPVTSPTVTQASAARSAVNYDKLLEDPLLAQPMFAVLVDRRNALARQDSPLESFEATAAEYEKLGAFYSAMEIIWWADKLTDNEAKRQAYQVRMLELQEKSRKGQADVDAALQIWASGGPTKAIERLREISLTQPYNEKAHYELGYRVLLGTSAHDTETKGAIPLDMRLRHFRLCYEEFLITIAIDPLYNDAYYQLNQARSMLADQPEFLQRTNQLTQRSLQFMSEVLPAMSKIEEGDRTADSLEKAGDALAGVDQPAYAVFAYQAAVAAPGVLPEQAQKLRGKIDALRKDKLGQPAGA